MRSASGKGNGLSSIPSTTLKIVVLIPIPSARQATATASECAVPRQRTPPVADVLKEHDVTPYGS